MRALELYCGIGGLASAARDFPIEVVGAVDASAHVVATYNRNFEPVARQVNILQLDVDDFAAYDAELWWMSPPCAPYTRRGNRLDLEDHRTGSYLRVLDAIAALRPPIVAMENVEYFRDSAARARLLEALEGYELWETVLCPTRLGVPNKRPRYYLVARRGPHADWPPALSDERPLASWRSYLESDVNEEDYRVPDAIVERYGAGFHVMDDSEVYTTCFTGGYGKSWNYTGSYVRLDDGGLRRFTPREVLNFLGFDRGFEFGPGLGERQQYKYAGNSLSIPAVRTVLTALGAPCDT